MALHWACRAKAARHQTTKPVDEWSKPMNEASPLPVRRRGGVPQRRSLFHPFDNLRQEMEDLFDTYFPSTSLSSFDEAGRDLARLDVMETEHSVEISVDLPGMDPKDVDITLTDGALMIRGERVDSHEDKARDYRHVERRYGAFYRRVALPCDVNEDQVEARFENGVLTVSLPKSTAAKEHERKIHIKAA
ncbi:hypothetical protein CKO24_00730 [Rhodothalassium salexigens DSM 2132]|nr:hypothetical protein [Rhodothalassium salexigens DSM 2132]